MFAVLRNAFDGHREEILLHNRQTIFSLYRIREEHGELDGPKPVAHVSTGTTLRFEFLLVEAPLCNIGGKGSML